MSLDDGMSKFIGSLYEAVYDRDGWRAAMGEAVRRTASRIIVATTIDLRRKDVADIRYHGREDSSVETGTREYVEAMSALDPVLEWMRQHPDGARCHSTGVMTQAGYEAHEVVKWSKSRFGTPLWSVCYSRPVDDLTYAMTFFPRADAGPPDKRALALHELLFENMERAVRLAVRPPNFAADDSALIAIDAAARPLSLSRRAEELLAEGDALVVRNGVLTSRSPETAVQLRQAVRAAIDPSAAAPGRGVRVRRKNGKPDLFVIVSRFPPPHDHVARPAPAGLVRIVELERRPHSLDEHSHLFDLTPRETEIASALLEGHSVESLAASLHLSRNTVRNHLQALFRKTGTNRQSDLLRMLDRLTRH